MDSDDEFMSGASSREEEDFEGTQDSDGDGSLGEGMNPTGSLHLIKADGGKISTMKNPT